MLTRLQLLKQCLSLQAESGKEKEQINSNLYLILDNIKFQYNIKLQIEEQDNGTIYITKGTTDYYPCFVAHSDDVAKYNPNKTLITFDNADWIRACDKITGVPHDVAGDDKCGIWAAFQALIDLPAVKVAIFVSEENGCNGSKNAKMEFFKDCQFVAQFDRKHNENDFINFTNGVKVCSSEFETFIAPYLNKYEYKLTSGTCTDVGQLRKNGLEISSFNISAGYGKAHTNDSFVVPSKLFKSYDLVIELFKNFKGQSVFKQEIKSETTFTSSNEIVSDVSKLLSKKFYEIPSKDRNNTPSKIINWVLNELNSMDEKLEFLYPDYTCVIDILWDYLLTEEEEKRLALNDVDKRKSKYICKNQFCQEPRQVDYWAMGGPEEVCTKCNKVFPHYTNNQLDVF